MRVVQAGYERCAADYQTRIKALNAQTQVSNCVKNTVTIFMNVANNDVIPNSRMLRKHTFTTIAYMRTNMNTLKVQTMPKNSLTNWTNLKVDVEKDRLPWRSPKDKFPTTLPKKAMTKTSSYFAVRSKNICIARKASLTLLVVTKLLSLPNPS